MSKINIKLDGGVNVDFNDLDTAIDFLEKEKTKIKVGDTVKVIRKGELYSTFYAFFYDEFFNTPVLKDDLETFMNYAGRYAYSEGIDTSDIYKVLYISKDGNKMLITKTSSYYGKVYIIHKDGISKYTDNTRRF